MIDIAVRDLVKEYEVGQPVLNGLTFQVDTGERVGILGRNGAGKTALFRILTGQEEADSGQVIIPAGKRLGLISQIPVYTAGYTVEDELRTAFDDLKAMEQEMEALSDQLAGGDAQLLAQYDRLQAAYETGGGYEIETRLEKICSGLGISKDFRAKDFAHLSGGEKQKIACAGVSIMEPDVLVMDEPSSNLDASSILDLRALLAFWKSQGNTIIVSEHRLYYLRGLADRFIYITGGKVEKDYSAAEFESLTEQQRAKLGLRTFILEDLLPPKALPHAGQQMELHNFCFAYKNEPETLHIRESKIPANRIVGIIGNNGAGKSTFSRCFCGLEKRCGEVIWNGRTYRPKDRLNTCYMVMQEVNHQLFTETVLDEVLISMEEENQEWAEEILAELDLI